MKFIDRISDKRWKRIVILITAPIWTPAFLIICAGIAIGEVMWEGAPGDCLRWVWHGADWRSHR